MASLTDSKEFRDALAKAKDEIRAEALAAVRAELSSSLNDEMRAALAKASPNDEPGMVNMFRQMALAIAEISDQGTARKRVAPEVLSERAEARKRMGELIAKARKNNEAPEYRLIAKCYFHERLVEPFQRGPGGRLVPTEVIWDGVPNEAMRPLNDVADGIYREFLKSIGGSTDINGISNQPFWVTNSGLTVKGPVPATATMHGLAFNPDAPEVGDGAAAKPFSERFAVKTQTDPTAPFVSVLGTVAPPARQGYAGGEHERR